MMCVSEYLDRIESASLKILEERKAIDRTITLWWGFDGLRLNKDGALEWITRKKSAPVNQNVFYQQNQALHPSALLDMCQSPQSAINMLILQSAQQMQNAATIYALQNYMLSPPAYYVPMLNCCCNQLLQR